MTVRVSDAMKKPVLVVSGGSVILMAAVLSCGGGDSPAGAEPDAEQDAAKRGENDASPADAVATCDSCAAQPDAGSSKPPCGSDPWLTYGHDPQRTSATDACINGALTLTWKYLPSAPPALPTRAVFHALARRDGLFLQWSRQSDWGSQYEGDTAVDRVSMDGARVWTFETPTDTTYGNWATVALGSLFTQDDGMYVVDPATGNQTHTTGVDWWGSPTFDATRLYTVGTTNQPDCGGSGLFVGAFDEAMNPKWATNQNTARPCGAMNDVLGGIALESGILFYAPKYMPVVSGSLKSGVYAFDGATGASRWSKPFISATRISVGNGNVYLAGEAGAGLVALRQSDGSTAWSQPAVNDNLIQAPLLAGGRVIVANLTSGAQMIAAFDAVTGTPLWSKPITFSAVYQNRENLTFMAAALGSSTLVVTTSTGLSVLALDTGPTLWSGAIAGADALHDPVLVGDRVYVAGGLTLYALTSM
jgi:outer membrane protein assembly factor BamB